MKIGFVGLGTMGGGMAARLLAAGYAVTVYNRSPVKAQALVSKGARLAAGPANVARDADVVIMMLADDVASRTSWTGEGGALEACAPGTVCVDCGTITPEWARTLNGLAQAKGCQFLDAPVTGSRLQAQNGELLFLVGGPGETLEQIRPVFAAMGRGVIHLGAAGAGATAKLINNFLCGVQLASLAEAMRWIEGSCLDPAQMLKILLDGAPASPLVKVLADRMVRRDYVPNFALELLAKDLRYAISEARESEVTLETAKAALVRCEQAVTAGFGDQDMSSLGEFLRTRADA